MGNPNELQVLLISCDLHHIYSPVCQELLGLHVLPQISMATRQENVLFYSSQSKTLDGSVTNLTTGEIRSKNGSDSWTSRLQIALNHVSAKYVLLVQEDHWYYKFLNASQIKVVLNALNDRPNAVMVKLNSFATLGSEAVRVTSDYGVSVFEIGSQPSYIVSHHATIFRKDWLLQNVQDAISNEIHTPWEHEIWNMKNAKVDISQVLQISQDNAPVLESVVTKGHFRANDFLRKTPSGDVPLSNSYLSSSDSKASWELKMVLMKNRALTKKTSLLSFWSCAGFIFLSICAIFAYWFKLVV